MTVADCVDKSIVYIRDIEDCQNKQYLLALGFVPKTKIEILCISQKRRTFLLSLRGYVIAIKSKTAAKIIVEAML